MGTVGKKITALWPYCLAASLLGHLLTAVIVSYPTSSVEKNPAEVFISEIPGNLGARSGQPSFHEKTKTRVRRLIVAAPIPEVTHAEATESNSQLAVSAGIGAAAGTAAGTGGSIGDFTSQLRAALESEKEYPAVARARHQTGRVSVGFTLRKEDGLFVNIHFVQISDYERLNRSAIETVKRVARFKPVPDEVSKGDWNVVVPLEFTIDD